MLELADVFREYGPEYRAKYGDRMLQSHKKAMQDIECCRTEVMGGHVYYCDACDEHLYAYHSCGNRHCPKCGQDRADRWRDKQLRKLLPVPYFMITFTLPHSVNPLARSHQKLFYRLLFQTSADTLHAVALNPTWLGGQIGMVGVMHTWTRNMGYHLHVHYLVPGGGIDPACRRSEPTAVSALAKQLGISRMLPRSRVFGRYNLTYLDASEPHEIDSGTGAFLLVRRGALDDAGGRLDERFFLYGEDLDLCRRIRQAGHRILYWPELTALHMKGSGRIRDARTTRHFYRAMWIYYRKWGRFRSNPMVLAALAGGLVTLGSAELARNAFRRTLRTGKSK